jgi:hypothetical protein
MEDKTLRLALNGLSHPLTVGAVILLLINDHYWRHAAPSWWTGKIGDFTWLMFAPFICAVGLAIVVPKRWENRERIIGIVSFGFIGVWFATAKTIPFAHQVTTDAVEWIIGWEGTLRRDVTDLLTLSALGVGWWIWLQSGRQRRRYKAHVWAIMALGIVGTLANGGYTPSLETHGIPCVVLQDNGSLMTIDFFEYSGSIEDIAPYEQPLSYQSYNGGLFWIGGSRRNSGSAYNRVIEQLHLAGQCSRSELPYEIPASGHLIRYEAGKRIEESTDGGQHWVQVYDLEPFQHKIRQRIHLDRARDKRYVVIEPGPHDVVYDEKTGNLVFAMGWDGVLVRTAAGDWYWVKVGRYHLADMNPVYLLLSRLLLEIVFASILFFLVLGSCLWLKVYPNSRLQTIALIILWISWTLIVSRLFSGLWVVWLVSVLFLMLLIVLDFIRLGMRYVSKRDVLTGLGASVLFLLTYGLWEWGTIPVYETAILFSLILTTGVIVSAVASELGWTMMGKDENGVVEIDEEGGNRDGEDAKTRYFE